MNQDLNQQLVNTRERLERRRKLTDRLAAARQSLEKERSRVVGLQAELNKEGRDVEKLEGLSLSGLFHRVLGNREEQLDQERQEYLRAKLKFDQSEHAVQALEREIRDMEWELEGLAGVETLYETLLAKKEQALAQGQDETAAQLLQITNEMADAGAKRREIEEALAAGRTVHNNLEQMLDSLQSAGNWGTFDMLGGGLLATAVKHSRVDEARELAYQAQEGLRRFQRELADVSQAGGALAIDIGSFETFADFFFDGLIMDWVVQSKIHNAMDSTTQVQRQVSAILSQLEAQQAQIQRHSSELEREKERLIEKAA